MASENGKFEDPESSLLFALEQGIRAFQKANLCGEAFAAQTRHSRLQHDFEILAEENRRLLAQFAPAKDTEILKMKARLDGAEMELEFFKRNLVDRQDAFARREATLKSQIRELERVNESLANDLKSRKPYRFQIEGGSSKKEARGESKEAETQEKRESESQERRRNSDEKRWARGREREREMGALEKAYESKSRSDMVWMDSISEMRTSYEGLLREARSEIESLRAEIFRRENETVRESEIKVAEATFNLRRAEEKLEKAKLEGLDKRKEADKELMSLRLRAELSKEEIESADRTISELKADNLSLRAQLEQLRFQSDKGAANRSSASPEAIIHAALDSAELGQLRRVSSELLPCVRAALISAELPLESAACGFVSAKTALDALAAEVVAAKRKENFHLLEVLYKKHDHDRAVKLEELERKAALAQQGLELAGGSVSRNSGRKSATSKQGVGTPRSSRVPKIRSSPHDNTAIGLTISFTSFVDSQIFIPSPIPESIIKAGISSDVRSASSERVFCYFIGLFGLEKEISQAR